MFFFYFLLTLLSSVYSITLERPDDLKKFFEGAYIEKVKGMWDKKTNTYMYTCFREGWALYHLHNVCVRAGLDGLVTGLEGTENDWMEMQKTNPNIISSDEFNIKNKKDQTGDAIDPIKSIKIDKSHINKIIYLKGGALFNNCYQQTSSSLNPAHWLMKLGAMYEIAQCEISNKVNN